MTTTKTATKRGSGEGSWKHLGNNKWKVTITVGTDINGKQVRRSKTGTKKECLDWLKEYQTGTCDNYFYDYAMKWLELKKPSITTTTYILNKYRIKRIAKINNFRISRVNDFVLNTIISELQKTQKPQTLQLSVSILRQVLMYAFYQKHINVMPYLPTPRKYSPPAIVKIPSVKEVQSILVAAKFYINKSIYPILLLGFLCGMRLGEILALNNNDINLNKSTILIHKTVARNIEDKPYIKEGAKTLSSNREIYVNSIILQEVLRYSNKSNEQLFLNRAGKIFDVSTMSHRIAVFFRKCGYNLTSHKARHTFVTLAQENGVSLLFVSKYVGHTSNSVTLNTYTHIKIDEPNSELEHFISLFL